ncbi:hypothetical protein L873DRAFT_1802863 [Choiromyces venosus 120613-1]|uniref:Tc1-like transposase DDE domain-containing protein n=1 Tax=Choiromyces venosus 120613-1 TaxID=1336337 RepID=A0A3N4K7S7_9PEZI|nr:hypothetical protein L873DRAFT_1802863 [Choiromyces venosus 120613-1]
MVPLHFKIYNSYNDRYENNRDTYLITFLLSSNTPISNIWVIEDNAKYHLTGLNQAITSTFKVQKLLLLANSPDLNPMENVWHILKAQLCKRFTKNKWERPSSEDELWKVMEEEWDAIDQEVLDKLAEGMPRRVEAIIAVNGNHVKL